MRNYLWQTKEAERMRSEERTDRQMGKTLVVTSGKGGVGKTTVTVNVGAALAKEGMNVLLIDADLGLRNLDLMMGLENRIVYDIVDVLEGRCRLRQAVVRSRQEERLAMLPASQTRNKNALEKRADEGAY